MGDGVTGGGLMGKDLSKGDVSINIVAFILAQRYGTQIEACCSIGDEQVTFNGYYCAEAFSKGLERLPITMPFSDVVEQARLYIHTLGGFEKFAEWGLVRPLAQV
jgi:S-adenosylmethionine synthetase